MTTQLPRSGEVLLLIDLSCWVHKFYATTGQHASWHCFTFLEKTIAELKPSHVAVCCDTGWPTFRHKMARTYKGNRKEPDPLLLEQRRVTREMMEDCLGLPPLERRGYEADDVIATLAVRGMDADMSVVVLGEDKDLLQLVGPCCVLWNGKLGRKMKLRGQAEVLDRYKVKAEQMRDFLALVGDASDNIPGARGIGPKAACDLLTAFGTLDRILEFSSKEPVGPFEKSRKLRELVTKAWEDICLSADLVTLRTDVPLRAGLGWARLEDAGS